MIPILYTSLIDTITPIQVEAFLRRKGWRQVRYANPDLKVFEGVAPSLGEEVSVVIPSQKGFADYPMRLRDCVQLLSQFYDKSADIIIHNIAHWDRDVFKIRVESPIGKEQLLPLDFAAKVIKLYSEFIAFAATTEIDPRRFFAKFTKAGQQFTDKCMFGHTFAGSFGLTVECPLDLLPEFPLLNAPPPRPFPRAVTERIASGYTNLSAAVRDENPDILIQNYKFGFSGNMCELLSDIYETLGERELSHGVIWAPELHPPEHLLDAETPIKIERKSYEILKIASAALQTVEEPDQDKKIFGRITSLKSEQPPLNTEEFVAAARTIVVNWEVEDHQVLHIHIELPLELYIQACDAHKNGRKIEVVGKPKKIGKFWKLTDHHDFTVI